MRELENIRRNEYSRKVEGASRNMGYRISVMNFGFYVMPNVGSEPGFDTVFERRPAAASHIDCLFDPSAVR